ncbi:BQ5605_C012g06878 [Microbotryum silenes-dioicae]|uniref:BQ5605_C012g06878 protein n=1 Tax=Microbotryum silenes-dioicae TaxID=796604 RepID=A0A2X0LSK5_9BASI|nr:BQ5605_C012g06878 [Microbotryum silenes-dioicae]
MKGLEGVPKLGLNELMGRGVGVFDSCAVELLRLLLVVSIRVEVLWPSSMTKVHSDLSPVDPIHVRPVAPNLVVQVDPQPKSFDSHSSPLLLSLACPIQHQNYWPTPSPKPTRTTSFQSRERIVGLPKRRRCVVQI